MIRRPGSRNDRILILAPTGRDAQLVSAALNEAGLPADVCASMDDLCARLDVAGTAIIAEEALTRKAMDQLRQALEKQPPWADLPLMIFTSQPSAELTIRSVENLGARANVTMIERPIRVKTMLSAARAALRARDRQYEIRDLVDELQRRVEERDNFLAMLSHELRNPLAAISLAVESSERPEAMVPEAAIISRQTRHLAKLVDDLLDIARVTTGKISLNKTEVDLADLVEHCAEMMRARADAHGLTLTLRIKAPHATVFGDPVRLEQIVNNLLSNAVKYTPSGGGIEVSLEAEHGEAVLSVRDTGKGIAPEMLTRIWDMFTQAETTLDRSEGGMGIGLTLVKKLVELHGGDVRAYSRGRGNGSEFIIRLALTQPKTAAPRRPAAKPLPEKTSSRRILVIEDNTDIRDLLRIKLHNLGHKVDTAEDGAKGLEKLLANRPEIALVDIGLPGIDGYEVARRVRRELDDHVYLIALTGYGQAEDRKKALEAGFNVHLTKPADFVDLQNVLGRVPL
ncbi:MAG TPA: ATP-binding protein [Thermoanaerobaculia bacterium]|nr:ATP-binding protein [Thermoanaerobaculia bacterium]